MPPIPCDIDPMGRGADIPVNWHRIPFVSFAADTYLETALRLSGHYWVEAVADIKAAVAANVRAFTIARTKASPQESRIAYLMMWVNSQYGPITYATTQGILPSVRASLANLPDGPSVFSAKLDGQRAFVSVNGQTQVDNNFKYLPVIDGSTIYIGGCPDSPSTALVPWDFYSLRFMNLDSTPVADFICIQNRSGEKAVYDRLNRKFAIIAQGSLS